MINISDLLVRIWSKFYGVDCQATLYRQALVVVLTEYSIYCKNAEENQGKAQYVEDDEQDVEGISEKPSENIFQWDSNIPAHVDYKDGQEQKDSDGEKRFFIVHGITSFGLISCSD